MSLRPIVKTTRGMPASDGAGVKLTRMLGTPELRALDPFLMLDKFHSNDPGDYLAGFPPHPHRGFETVTYMVEGRMRHQDNKGHEGVIGPGGVQWMTAARGIIHSEMPEQDDGLMSGFQLWVNLPRAEKMKDPGYQEFGEAQIPADEREGVTAKIVTGRTSTGVEGPVRDITVEPFYAELRMAPGERVRRARRQRQDRLHRHPFGIGHLGRRQPRRSPTWGLRPGRQRAHRGRTRGRAHHAGGGLSHRRTHRLGRPVRDDH